MNKQTKAYAVYALYWPGRPEVYVGCSKNAQRRWQAHRNKWAGSPRMMLIDECDTQEEAWESEKRWIRLMYEQGEPLINSTFGGSLRGQRMLPEYLEEHTERCRKTVKSPEWVERVRGYANPEWGRRCNEWRRVPETMERWRKNFYAYVATLPPKLPKEPVDWDKVRAMQRAAVVKWQQLNPELVQQCAEHGRAVMADPVAAESCAIAGGMAMDDPEIRQRCFDRQAEVHQSVWWKARTQAGHALYWAKQQGIPHSVLTRPKYHWGKKV